jgi:hypothetical protein
MFILAALAATGTRRAAVARSPSRQQAPANEDLM